MDPFRRRLLLLAAASPLAAEALAQTDGRVHVVGYWGYWSASGKPTSPPGEPRSKWFEGGLAKHGFVRGRNLRIAYVFTGRDYEAEVPSQARELLAQKPDVICVRPAPGVRGRPEAIRALNREVPLTFSNVDEENAAKIVGGDVRRPAGNVTGVGLRYFDWFDKRLELARQLVPKAGRVAVVMDAELWAGSLDRLKAAGRQLGLEVVILDVARRGGGMKASVEEGNAALAATLDEMIRSRPDAFMAFGAFNAVNRFNQLIEFELRHKLPLIGDGGGTADAAGVVAYGMDYDDHHRRLIEIVVQILRGAKVADIPVDFTSRFLLRVNLKRAKEIGLRIPPAVLVRADQIVQ